MTGFGPDPALEVLEGLSINCSSRGTADFVGQGGLAEGTFLDKLCRGSATHRWLMIDMIGDSFFDQNYSAAHCSGRLSCGLKAGFFMVFLIGIPLGFRMIAVNITCRGRLSHVGVYDLSRCNVESLWFWANCPVTHLS